MLQLSSIALFASKGGSDHPFVAAVDRNLRAGNLGEQHAAHFRREFGNVLAADLFMQEVVDSAGIQEGLCCRRLFSFAGKKRIPVSPIGNAEEKLYNEGIKI